MTAAPLPAPRPCPFCGKQPIVEEFREEDDGEIVGYGAVECHCIDGTIAFHYGTVAEAIAAWNRRAPEAQAWRAPGVSWVALSDERPPERAGQYALLHGARMDPIMIRWHSVYRVWEGDWPGERKSLDDILTMFTEDGDTFTHWAPVAPPSATPATPAPAVEALRAEAREALRAAMQALRENPTQENRKARDEARDRCDALAAAEAGEAGK